MQAWSGGPGRGVIYSPVLMNQLEAKKKGTEGPSWLPIDVSPRLRPNISVKPNRLLHLGLVLLGNSTNSPCNVP